MPGSPRAALLMAHAQYGVALFTLLGVVIAPGLRQRQVEFPSPDCLADDA